MKIRRGRQASLSAELAAWGARVRASRKRQGITLPTLSEMTSLSTGWLSQLERGLVTPSDHARTTIQVALGMVLPADLPTVPDDTDTLARLGACLAVVRKASIAELGRATGLTDGAVRVGLRLLSEALGPLGMRVIDDGVDVLLQPRRDLDHVPRPLTERQPHPPLSELQQWLTMMAVYRGSITVAEVTDLRGTESWRLVQSVVQKGYLVQNEQDGRYRPTHLLLEKLGSPDTFEELRAQMQAMLNERSREELSVRFPEPSPAPPATASPGEAIP